MLLRVTFYFINRHFYSRNLSITVADKCMGRLFFLEGCYGVQEEGGTNDGEAWSCIDEGRWKEGGNKTEGGGELMTVGGPDSEIGNVDGRQKECCLEVWKADFWSKTWLVAIIFPLRQQLGQVALRRTHERVVPKYDENRRDPSYRIGVHFA
jgi:hypothetical protein